MKKIIIALLVVLMLLGTYTIINVEESYVEEDYVPINCVDINELSTLPYEDTYTYQEVFTDMQHNNLISKEKIN